MSGIYIPGMEMPKNCEECSIKSWDTEDYVCPFSGISTLCISRQDSCPLIAVQDHGRLIDADALIDDLKRQCKEVFRIDAVSPEDFWINRNEAYRQRLYESWCEGFYEYVGSRPTIIPADKESDSDV